MKRTMRIAITVTGVLCGVVAYRLTTAVAQTPALPTFTVAFRETVVTSDGRSWVAREFLVAQRANGDRMRTVPTRARSGEVVASGREIRFTSQGITVAVNDRNDNIFTMGKGDGGAMLREVLRPQGTDCEKVIPVNQKREGTEQLAGVRAIRTSRSDSAQDATYWYAPDLGCEIIKKFHLWKDAAGNRDGRATHLEPLSISMQDPGGSLFQIPIGAVEVRPSLFFQALDLTPADYSRGARLDAAWEKHRAVREGRMP